MSFRTSIVRGLMSTLFMAVLITVILQPQNGLSGIYALAFILIVEGVAVGLSYWLAHGGAAQAFIRTLILALVFAGAIVFFFNPADNLGFDTTFLLIVIVELLGLTAAWGITRSPRMKK